MIHRSGRATADVISLDPSADVPFKLPDIAVWPDHASRGRHVAFIQFKFVKPENLP